MEYPNWFEPYARPLFEKYLLSMAGQPGLRFLQIGAFTGDASLWMLRNVLTGEGSTLTDVDTWLGSDELEHKLLNWLEVERVYDERMRGFTARGMLTKVKLGSGDYFKAADDLFDFIYIDGDHDGDVALADGTAALELLKPGGLLAFDDYQWQSRYGGHGPGWAADALSSRVTVLELSAQAWFTR